MSQIGLFWGTYAAIAYLGSAILHVSWVRDALDEALQTRLQAAGFGAFFAIYGGYYAMMTVLTIEFFTDPVIRVVSGH